MAGPRLLPPNGPPCRSPRAEAGYRGCGGPGCVGSAASLRNCPASCPYNEKRWRGSQCRNVRGAGQARKPVIEDTDDLPNDRPLFGPVTLAIVLPELGPEFIAGRQPDRHDGFAGRAERRIGTKRLNLYPGMLDLVIHDERTEKMQTECMGSIREGRVNPQRDLDERREKVTALVQGEDLLVHIAAFQHLKYRRMAIRARHDG